MTVTKPQAQMLATLAAACRPNGARRWDTAGTMAAIKQFEQRDLAEVTMAFIRGARDKDCRTPAGVAAVDLYWREVLAPLPFVPKIIERTERCSVCDNPRRACQMLWAHDHEFRSIATAAKEAAASDPAALTTAIHALKASIEPTEEPPVKTLDELKAERPEFAARLDAIAARHPVPPTQEPATEEPA